MTLESLRLHNRTDAFRRLCDLPSGRAKVRVRSSSTGEGWHATATNLTKAAPSGEERLWLHDSARDLAAVLASHEEGVSRDELEAWLASFD